MPRVPVNALHSDIDALVQRAAADHLFHPFPALTELYEDRRRLTGADVVFAAQLNRIDLQFFRELVHRRFERKVPLCCSVPAVRTGDGEVCVHYLAVEVNVFRFVVQRQCL